MNNIQEEIFRSIENIANKSSSSPQMDMPTVILGEEGGKKYRVKINGVDRTVTDGIGLDLKIGDMVWCHAMNGDAGQIYVMCRR